MFNIFFLYFFLNYYLLKFNFLWIKKILNFFYSLFYLLEYILVFYIRLSFIYILILYNFFFIEKMITIKQLLFIFIFKKKNNKNLNLKKKRKINLNLNLYNKFYKIYYKRKMYYGFSIVYTQMLLRKIKEMKNYIIFFFENKWKKIYVFSKKKIIYLSFVLYISINYNLINFFFNIKKKIFNIIVKLSFFELYNIMNLKLFFFKIFYKK